LLFAIAEFFPPLAHLFCFSAYCVTLDCGTFAVKPRGLSLCQSRGQALIEPGTWGFVVICLEKRRQVHYLRFHLIRCLRLHTLTWNYNCCVAWLVSAVRRGVKVIHWFSVARPSLRPVCYSRGLHIICPRAA